MLKTILSRLQRLNPLLFACMAGLIVIGVTFVYSACSVRGDPELRMLYMRHAEVGVAGLVIYLALALTNYRIVIRRWSGLVYLVCLVLLVLVPLIGEVRMGAQRWLFGIQPSEPAKLAIIMM
ncbi:MAG TPA: FtsW/RodA/SpoVE family cell cycle protein, partial [Kiritimatiellia bacterium]|nr:FtsW/RodA/SpoVE family cell cycle protein [Kiritimatiellia bacterium]